MSTENKVLDNLARFLVQAFQRARRTALISGAITAISIFLAAEGVAALLLHAALNGWGHAVIVASALLVGYLVVLSVLTTSTRRTIIQLTQMTRQEAEKLAMHAITEVEALAREAEGEALRLGRGAISEAGALGRERASLGRTASGTIGGIVGGVEHGIGRVVGAVEHEIASHVPKPVAEAVGVHTAEPEYSSPSPRRTDAPFTPTEKSSPSSVVSAPSGGVAPEESPSAIGTDSEATDSGASGSRFLHHPQFTAFHEKVIDPGTWHTLLVYAHLASAFEAVRGDALRVSPEVGSKPLRKPVDALLPLRLGVTITIVPQCDGVTFNPARQSFTWVEDWHRAEFRFRASTTLSGTAVNGKIYVYLDLINIATIAMPLLCLDEPLSQLPQDEPTNREIMSADPYTKVFMSYSHEDTPVVAACSETYRALGLSILRDRESLRPGELWHPAIQQMISDADIFQLFWSSRAARSAPVQEEWKYAVQLTRGEGFIRPVFWEEPLEQPPPELAPYNFHFLPSPRVKAS